MEYLCLKTNFKKKYIILCSFSFQSFVCHKCKLKLKLMAFDIAHHIKD